MPSKASLPRLSLLALAALALSACGAHPGPSNGAAGGGGSGNGSTTASTSGGNTGGGQTGGAGTGGAHTGGTGGTQTGSTGSGASTTTTTSFSTTGTPPPPSSLPRVVAYVNCLCGFGASSAAGECLADPDPTINHVKEWEDSGQSPITNYVISFASFQGSDIQTDPGEIWATGGGSTSDFNLQPNLKSALSSAKAHGKKVFLSLGGEVGSSGFVSWWNGLGGAGASVGPMQAKLSAAAQLFAQQNGFPLDGFDVDIELGGAYAYGSDKYNSTRDLINAVPDGMLVAFVPQVGNGLCAAPAVGDPLNPTQTLGGQCSQPVNGDDTPWVLARLDKECTKADGSPRLDYFGIQYYNAGAAVCCGGGGSDSDDITSTWQSYKNLANGWPIGDLHDASNPFHAYEWYPGPWAAFAGIGADRLVLGKPACQGCAGSDYLGMPSMTSLISMLDKKLTKPMGGILFWDLCRLFGNTGPQCVSGTCQPSWGGATVLDNLTSLKAQMDALTTQ